MKFTAVLHFQECATCEEYPSPSAFNQNTMQLSVGSNSNLFLLSPEIRYLCKTREIRNTNTN